MRCMYMLVYASIHTVSIQQRIQQREEPNYNMPMLVG